MAACSPSRLTRWRCTNSSISWVSIPVGPPDAGLDIDVATQQAADTLSALARKTLLEIDPHRLAAALR